jgi:hypothetical protein
MIMRYGTVAVTYSDEIPNSSTALALQRIADSLNRSIHPPIVTEL